MPAVKFTEEHRKEGLYQLIIAGDVRCYRSHIYVVPSDSLKSLEEAGIPYQLVDGKDPHVQSRSLAPPL